MKVTRQKTSPSSEHIQAVFDCWNERGPIKHRGLSEYKRNISGKLRFYSVSQLCRAIREYQNAHFGGDLRFWYALCLSEFLSRHDGLGFFLGHDIISSDFKEPDFVDFKKRLN